MPQVEACMQTCLCMHSRLHAHAHSRLSTICRQVYFSVLHVCGPPLSLYKFCRGVLPSTAKRVYSSFAEECWLLIKDAVWTEAADSCCCRCAGFLYTCCCCHCAAHSSRMHLLPGRNKFIERMLRWAWPKSSPGAQFQVRHGAVGQEH